MKTVLLFGAGKSATVLIDYLLNNAKEQNWKVLVVDADLPLAQSKVGSHSHAEAISFDINNQGERSRYIKLAAVVISLLPPALHIEVAKECLKQKKHLLTASYTDDAIRQLSQEITDQKLLFLYEMGLDPGIDHMSAMQIMDGIREKGGTIVSFKSHCGGLVAPESDDNPWHYKISWNPRNIVLAGKAGARFLENGIEKTIGYEELFANDQLVRVAEDDYWGYYPNRDSIGYKELYELNGISTFIRTTLRHPDFMYGWKNIIELKLTDETKQYETDGKTLQQVFKEHMDKHGFSEWLNEKLSQRMEESKSMLENLMKLAQAENEVTEEGENLPQSFMAADADGNLEELQIDEIKNRAAAYLAQRMHETNLTLKQLFFLGLDDDETIVNRGLCSPADLLQFAMERKLMLRPYDKDMIIMLHEIVYETGGKQSEIRSSLVVKGENSLRTAMAKTVGLPLGIAAKLILQDKLQLRGLHIPTDPAIYEPVLQELRQYQVQFIETDSPVQ